MLKIILIMCDEGVRRLWLRCFWSVFQESETEFLPDYDSEVDVRGQPVGPTEQTTEKEGVDERGAPAVGPTEVQTTVVEEHGTPAMVPTATMEMEGRDLSVVEPTTDLTAVLDKGSDTDDRTATTEVEERDLPVVEPTTDPMEPSTSTSTRDLEVTGDKVHRTVKVEEQSLLVTVREELRRDRRRKATNCNWCPEKPSIPDKFRRHLIMHHLPWYFDPQLACWYHRTTFGQLGVLFHRHRRLEGCKSGRFEERELLMWLAKMTNLLLHIAIHLGVKTEYELLALV